MADPIAFEYHRDPPGLVRVLDNWHESPKYLIGIDTQDQRFKQFRKDRIRRYLDGAEALLDDPFPPPLMWPPPELAMKNTSDLRPQILFTGFSKEQRAILEAKADTAGMRICKNVTKSCMYLVAGPNESGSCP